MAYTTLITGPERRRRWSEEQKRELLSRAFGPGGNVTETGRGADIHTSLLYRWRRASLMPVAAAAFVPAVVVEGPEHGPEQRAGPVVIVELSGGIRVSVTADAPAALVTATLQALR
jgi:transposase